MKESTTYQAIMDEGKLAEARRLLLGVGQIRFKTAPTAEQQTIFEAIAEVDRLEQLLYRASQVNSWAAVLEPEASSDARRARRKKPT